MKQKEVLKRVWDFSEGYRHESLKSVTKYESRDPKMTAWERGGIAACEQIQRFIEDLPDW